MPPQTVRWRHPTAFVRKQLARAQITPRHAKPSLRSRPATRQLPAKYGTEQGLLGSDHWQRQVFPLPCSKSGAIDVPEYRLRKRGQRPAAGAL